MADTSIDTPGLQGENSFQVQRYSCEGSDRLSSPKGNLVELMHFYRTNFDSLSLKRQTHAIDLTNEEKEDFSWASLGKSKRTKSTTVGRCSLTEGTPGAKSDDSLETDSRNLPSSRRQEKRK